MASGCRLLVGKLCQRQALTTPPGLRILPGLGRAWRCCASAKTSPVVAAQAPAASLPVAPSESSGGSPKVYRERLLDGEEEVLTEAEKQEKDSILKELTRRLSGPLADEHGNVPTGKDRPIAIEVDGPSHFYANTKRYTAYTKLKHRLLTRMGYKVLHVPYFEWRRLRGARERENYMREKLIEEPSEWLDPEDEVYYNQAPGDEDEEEPSGETPAARPPPSTPPPPPVQKQARDARRDDGPRSPAPPASSTPLPPTTPPPPPQAARPTQHVQAESKPPAGIPVPSAPPQHPRQRATAEAAAGAGRSVPLPPPPPPAATPAPFPVEEDVREAKQSKAPPPVPPPPPRAAAQVPGGIPDFPPQPKWNR